MLGPPFHVCNLLAPRCAVPDLQVVVNAGDDDLPPELGVLDERPRQHDPALLVGLRLGGGGVEVALHHAIVLTERVEGAEPRLDEGMPGLDGVGGKATVHPPGDDHAVGERLSELRG